MESQLNEANKNQEEVMKQLSISKREKKVRELLLNSCLLVKENITLSASGGGGKLIIFMHFFVFDNCLVDKV